GQTQYQTRTFPVIVVDEDTIKLGNTFTAGSVTPKLGDPHEGILEGQNAIQFATPHNFQTGDAVRYVPGTVGISGLRGSATYYVRVVDPYTIKLYPTWADAEGQGDAKVKDFAVPAAPVTFKTSAVEAGPGNALFVNYPNTIYLPGNTYHTGDAVVY